MKKSTSIAQNTEINPKKECHIIEMSNFVAAKLNLKAMSTYSENIKKVTTRRLFEMKKRGEKISMLTAYDYSMARLVDIAGIDVILVGDSASNVFSGNTTTLPITLDHMIYHGTAVTNAVKRAHVVVDMPFGSYQGNSREALASAIRIMKETSADSVKMEGAEVSFMIRIADANASRELP